MKKILCFLFAVLMMVSFVACDLGGNSGSTSSDEQSGTKVDSSIKTGEVAPVGDVFELPDVKQAAGAPIIAEISKQAYPGDSIMLSGEGFKSSDIKFFVYAQSESGNGKAYEAKFTIVDDNYASVLIDENLDYGMYGVYAQTSKGTSAIKTVNKPKIWSIGLYKLCAGENLTILGENLTTDNGDKTSAYLVSEDGKQYCEVSVLFADPGKVEIKIPEGLTAGAKYKVRIHNGHGGKEGFAESEEFVEYLDQSAVTFGGRVLNVVDYGADPEDRTNDDSKALNKVIRDMQNGDIIYFPPGSYMLASPITISKSVKILGAGADKTTIYIGYNVSGGVFNITTGPCEITGIRFEQKRTKGKLKGYVLDMTTSNSDSGMYSLYFHANQVIQTVTAKSRSANYSLMVNSGYGIIVEDNYYDATGMLYVSNGSKVYLRNNKATMNIYCGVYYQVTNSLFTNVDFLDVSNNEVTGAGAPADPKDGPGKLETDTLTAGRVFTCQGWTANTYICHNKVRRAGIPNTNSGEIIMYENVAYLYDGKVDTSTDTTTTVTKSDKNQMGVGAVITIVGGKGRGQYRVITKKLKSTVTVDRPWDIVPDSTSHVIVNKAFINAFVCYNELDGHANWNEVPGATTGLQAYGAIHNMFYCNNKVKNTSTGMDITPFYYKDITGTQESNARCVIAWNQFDRNTLEKMGRAITMAIQTTSGTPTDDNVGEICFGNVFRANTIKDISPWTDGDRKGSGGLGLRMGQAGSSSSKANWPGEWCTGNLYEANTFTNCVDDVIFYNNQYGNIFRNNTNGSGAKARYNVTDNKLAPVETTY